MLAPKFRPLIAGLVGLAWAGSVASAQGPAAPPRGSRPIHEGPLQDHSDVMCYRDYGWRAMRKGWYDSAEREFNSAIRIASKPTFNEPRTLALCYADLASALQKQGRSAEAEPLARWALETRVKHHGSNNAPIARSLTQVAGLDFELNRVDDAQKVLQRLADLPETSVVEVLQEKSRGETLWGLSLVGDRRFAEAEKHFQKALELARKSAGRNNAEVADPLSNLGWVMLEQGKAQESKPLFEESLRILGRTQESVSAASARAFEGLSRAETELHHLPSALSNALRALSIREKLVPVDEPSVASITNRCAELLEKLDRKDDARKLLERMTAGARPSSTARGAGIPPGDASS